MRDLQPMEQGMKPPPAANRGRANGRREIISFTPCSAADSLLEADIMAAQNALLHNVTLISPGQFYSGRFCHQPDAPGFFSDFAAVRAAAGTVSAGREYFLENVKNFAPGFYEEKPRREKQTKLHPQPITTLIAPMINK